MNKQNKGFLLGLSALIILGVILVTFFVFTQKNTVKKTITTSSAKPKEDLSFNLNNIVTGKVISIDKEAQKIVIETITEPSTKYTLYIPSETVINRETPDGKPHDYTKKGIYPVKFQEFRLGTVMKVFTKEDPNLTKQLSSKIIVVLV